MSDLATPQALLHRWDELLHDPVLRDLPYKIELNAWGKVEMSPASNRHGRLQALVAAELLRQLPAGTAITECSILTRIGIRVPDVAWASAEFMAAHGEITPYTRAPEICIEIVSSSNVEAEIEAKKSAYLHAGAKEVWLVADDGAVRYFDTAGEKAQSAFAVALTLPPPMNPL
ncbi:MAG: Uma2 family endonuclease [Burkholderiales bacterium]